HLRTDRREMHTLERLSLAPRREVTGEVRRAQLGGIQDLAQLRSSPALRPHANVAHAFDRLLVRRERVTQEQIVERMLRRSRRIEETAPSPLPLPLVKPAAPARPSADARTERAAARRSRREAAIRPQTEVLQAQWAAALDPNRLA